jgi:hypothetical protein
MQRKPFRHETIVAETPGSENDVCLLADLTGNGLLDVIVGGKYGRDNLCWYEAPDWACHVMGEAYLEAGGVLLDVNGSGRLDLIVGEAHGNGSPHPGGGHELYWFEQPPDPRSRWTRHVIENGLHRYHDQAVGDLDGDGEPELLICSQEAGIVAYYDIPAGVGGSYGQARRTGRWPYSARHIVAANLSTEGLVVADVDGSRRPCALVGTHLFTRLPEPGRPWTHRLIADMDRPAIAVGDLTDDGFLELVAAEGELDRGRLAWFELSHVVADALMPDPARPESLTDTQTYTPATSPPDPGRHAHLLADDLYHPHSLAVADFTGDGRPDILVGEMGLGRNENPRLIIYVNQGHGNFEPLLISEGVPTHNAAVGDLNGNGRIDVVGKPYKPGRCVDVWWNEW